MVFCDHCLQNVAGARVDDSVLCCENCGKVLEEAYLSNETAFTKNSAGQSQLAGNIVRSFQNDLASRERTLRRAQDNMENLSRYLGVEDISLAREAAAYYRIGLERNFTKGRKSELVQAACLYIAFREKEKPYLLIDFSNYLRTNVYELGTVFLQLCEVLRLGDHPLVQKPVDPSLFIHKYTNTLIKEKNRHVSETALKLVARMKRDWMQTGRKPSGICGAALYVAAQAHGFNCSKSDILRIVHVCEATLTKRLVEFENTESSSLTIDEFNAMANEHEKNPIKIPNGERNKCSSEALLCVHKDSGVPYFALGLCEECYWEFDKLSGGLSGGLDPPAFQRAERDRMIKSQSEENANKSDDLTMELTGAHESQIVLYASGPGSTGDDGEYVTTKDGEHDKPHIEDDGNTKTHDESESLSDIDDQEVDVYLIQNEEEKVHKKLAWESNNREYLEEQAVKEAAAAAIMKEREAEWQNLTPEEREAKKLAATVREDVAKSRKAMKQKRAQEAKSLGPAQSAAEATTRMLQTKRLSSKVNYDLLEKLFDQPAPPEKKVRFESPSDNDDNLELKSDYKTKENELKSVDEFEDGDIDGEYDNAHETYDYDDDYGYGGL